MSKYTKKRKHDLDTDTTADVGVSPEKSKRSRRREASGSPDRDNSGGNVESMSIEESNALRIKLGLAPLVVEEEAPKMRESESGDTTDKVITQDGIEFVHRAAESGTQAKLTEKLKEKLETHAAKRKVHAKVLKSKGLADSSDEDDEHGTESWIEAQRRKAEEKARELDQLDGEIEQAASKRTKRPPTAGKRRPQTSDPLAGMTVGHSKSSFMTGEETILVLDDKNVLDDDGEEVLVNPTLMYNEQLRKNKDLREKKPGYNPYDDEIVDEFGQVQRKNLLAKYDEEVDGPQEKEKFKLNARGRLDIAKEEAELRDKRKLFMANKQLQSLETPKYKVASEFYTEEEMISFRKPKKKKEKSGRKMRGSKAVLKADDLLPLEPEPESAESKEAREAKLRARRQGGNDDESQPRGASNDADPEDGEIIEAPKLEKTRFRNTMGANVDTSRLRSLASKLAESEESEDDDFGPMGNLTGVVIDDEVEDELSSALDRARKERLAAQATMAMDSATTVTEMLSKIKKEELDADEMDTEDGAKNVVFDATAEYYKTIGSRPTYGLAGNRDDEVDFSELQAEEAREQAKKEHRRKEREVEAAEDERRRIKKEKKHLLAASSKKEKESASKDDRGRSHRKHQRHRDNKSDEDDVDMEALAEESSDRKDNKKGVHENVLGKERDVTKGVAAMLKLAGEKGYLEDPNAKKNRGGTLKHLESKNFAKVEFSKHDIEDKYLKKMERVGTTGSGPVRPFSELRDYTPQVEIAYTDSQGREMEPKAAFRNMSHKFHGKAPGKKQVEKRMRQQEKKEKMKKMNSFDTPLGTLSKQIKKQEQIGTHYLLLSGNSRDAGAPLQKE